MSDEVKSSANPLDATGYIREDIPGFCFSNAKGWNMVQYYATRIVAPGSAGIALVVVVCDRIRDVKKILGSHPDCAKHNDWQIRYAGPSTRTQVHGVNQIVRARVGSGPRPLDVDRSKEPTKFDFGGEG